MSLKATARAPCLVRFKAEVHLIIGLKPRLLVLGYVTMVHIRGTIFKLDHTGNDGAIKRQVLGKTSSTRITFLTWCSRCRDISTGSNGRLEAPAFSRDSTRSIMCKAS